jgi:hypothetical protein
MNKATQITVSVAVSNRFPLSLRWIVDGITRFWRDNTLMLLVATQHPLKRFNHKHHAIARLTKMKSYRNGARNGSISSNWWYRCRMGLKVLEREKNKFQVQTKFATRLRCIYPRTPTQTWSRVVCMPGNKADFNNDWHTLIIFWNYAFV